MSRNMIEANQYIFALLMNFVDQSDVENKPPNGIRYIKTNKSEKQWLKNLNILKTQPILPNLRTATLYFKKKYYFVVVGWGKSESLDDILEPIPLNAGLVTALLFELKIPIRRDVTALELVDQILFRYKEDGSEYKGHDWYEVSEVFEPILAYQFPDSSPFKGDELAQISGFYLSKNPQQLSLPFSTQTIRSFEKIYLEGPASIPTENLLFSLTSVRWKYSFLDVYRCVEHLFSVFMLDKLHQRLKMPIPLIEFSVELEDHLGWRPKEDDTLKLLIEQSPEEAKQLLREVKLFLDSDAHGDLGIRFYKIRNAIVHYRPASERLNLNDENWDKLIRATLLIIEHWYTEYDPKLPL